MNFDLSDEQRILVDQVRGMLTERSAPSRLRSLIDSAQEWDELLWRELAEMGLLGITTPEAFGGLGMTELDLGIVSEALGRANAAVPFFSSVVLAASAIRLCGSEAQKARWLPAIASGETVFAFAHIEGSGGLDDRPAAKITNGRLTGFKSPVADAGCASMAVVVATGADGSVGLAIVDLDQPGVTRTRLAGFDELRAHYRLDFADAAAETLGAPSVEAELQELYDRAAIQAAFEAVGGSEACLFMARDYALQRPIFGRPLAGYQAIKHKLADVLIGVELARSSAYHAAWTADEDPDALPLAASAARLTAMDAFERAARENLQVHGGIGYTWEADCHFYYRRERLLALSLEGRERWARRLMNSLPEAVRSVRPAARKAA